MKIVIVDDDKFVCMSLKTIIQSAADITVAATGCNGAQAIDLYREHSPDILLMDIQMQGMSGLEAGERILKDFPGAKILFLTTFSDDEYIMKALRIGAKGYLIKQNVETIVPALRAVLSGQSVFGSEIVTKIPDLLNKPREFDAARLPLNQREKEVVELVAKGLNNREIADALFLSEGTVRNYISTVLDKLELRDRTQLVIFYYNNRK